MTSDDALLWARAFHAAQAFDLKEAEAWRAGKCDVLIDTDMLRAFRAGHAAGQSADAERVAVLTAENAELRGALRQMVLIYNDGETFSPEFCVRAMDRAQAALEGRQP